MVWNTTQSQQYEKNAPQKRSAAAKPCRDAAPPLSGSLLADGDALLLIGLILILMSERADQKLILALLFVLLT